MKKNKDLRKFLKDLKKRKAFRSAIGRAREVSVQEMLDTTEENLEQCARCKYISRCSEKTKGCHGNYTPEVDILGKKHKIKICSTAVSIAFMDGLRRVTEDTVH